MTLKNQRNVDKEIT
jgi:hypothetical protein